MTEQETRIVEIGGVKMEVDLREAKTVEHYRVGDLVKVLVKKYSDQYTSHAGVIIGFDDFKAHPTIVVAYLNVDPSEGAIKIAYIFEGSGHEITHASPSDVPFSKEKVLALLDKQIETAQQKVDQAQWHKDQFVQWFGKMFEPKEAIPSHSVMTECYSCVHRRTVPGNCHIRCAKPDPEMTGAQHGIDHGWFIYPDLFDPVWKLKACSNFESASNAVSGPVSRENDAVPIND